MPKLWRATIEGHRRSVREAILDVAAALARDHGLRSVTMSQIAEEVGIGRATLYKYFPDVEAVLRAWHERQVSGHLEHLGEVRDQPGKPLERLAAVLEAYARIAHEAGRHHDSELGALLHRDHQVVQAQQQLTNLIRDLIAAAAESGDLRQDVSPAELASYCLHALSAAKESASRAAVRRLVGLTMSGLHART